MLFYSKPKNVSPDNQNFGGRDLSPAESPTGLLIPAGSFFSADVHWYEGRAHWDWLTIVIDMKGNRFAIEPDVVSAFLERPRSEVASWHPSDDQERNDRVEREREIAVSADRLMRDREDAKSEAAGLVEDSKATVEPLDADDEPKTEEVPKTVKRRKRSAKA